MCFEECERRGDITLQIHRHRQSLNNSAKMAHLPAKDNEISDTYPKIQEGL
jgi:hypothetical protein